MKRSIRHVAAVALSLVSTLVAVDACTGDDPDYRGLGLPDGSTTPNPDAAPSPPPPVDGGNEPTDAEAGPCRLEGVTPYPCSDGDRITCYGVRDGSVEPDAEPTVTTLTCVPNGDTCEPAERSWQCNSSRQCGAGACCVGGFTDEQRGCSLRSLSLSGADGAFCATSAKCPEATVKLCQSDSQCLGIGFCSLVRVHRLPEGTGELNVAACIPFAQR